MERFKDKVALITGGTYGIGFAVAKRLAEEGAKIVICGRKENNIKIALENLRNYNYDVHGVQCHVGNPSDRVRLIEETIKKYGKLDIFISNVAVNPALVPVLECEESAWDKIFDVNVKASFILAKEAIVHLRKQGPGSNIVFISSVVGVDPNPMVGAYSTSKTALLGLTKAAARQLAQEGIRVNCVAPGFIETPFSDPLRKTIGPHYLLSIPMGRFGQPDEIAGVVAFLASDDASYITGETIVASGGMSSRL